MTMDEDMVDVQSPCRGDDSGYESAERTGSVPRSELPGHPPEKGEFKFHGTLAFVTYTRSRIQTKEEFERLLRESLGKYLPKLSADGDRGTLEVYGCKELHEDGKPHYHVLLRFNPRVHWPKARERFFVWIDVDGKAEVDTESIYIVKRHPDEPAVKFMQSVQSYISKGGDVFGHWIGPTLASAAEKAAERDAHLDEIIAVDGRQEAELLFQKYFKRNYVLNHGQIDAYLRKKKPPPALRHEPDFPVKPWRVPATMLQWRKANFGPNRSGRPVPLVIVGDSRCGKTEWSLSFGFPVQMTGGWNVDELLKPGCTHLVLNDIDDVSKFPNARDFAGCQRYITVTGKWKPEMTLEWNRPVIWTCNKDNNVMNHPKIGPYLKQTGAVVVKLGKKKLYVEDKEEVEVVRGRQCTGT